MALLVNDLIEMYGETYGDFDEIRIELPRELSGNAEKRQRDSKNIDDNQKAKDTCREELMEKLKEQGINVTYVSENDVLKYRLYKELAMNGYKTLYSNSKVNLIDLIMGRGFDKEHIIELESGKAKLFFLKENKSENALVRVKNLLLDSYEQRVHNN